MLSPRVFSLTSTPTCQRQVAFRLIYLRKRTCVQFRLGVPDMITGELMGWWLAFRPSFLVATMSLDSRVSTKGCVLHIVVRRERPSWVFLRVRAARVVYQILYTLN
ncbi:hypothetical protein CY34DRAFT_200730 [Suillus luteus UH-Slu-Lm8-n1]|uniref:Uncharacterized protein n=1 Tax=Suillus luteus UH-Slu-Lm8-n1 TaxID=930992 RepID=A0A0D0B514_9AGAM|nr:hypothetical protein CY34DRAFT_200730 [Suillus luteus UH-Slu-Lm8-n1]